jgi:hypothetical protein
MATFSPKGNVDAGDQPIPGYRDHDGRLPPRVLSLVTEWAALHRFELRRNWTLLATEGKFRRIDPLA